MSENSNLEAWQKLLPRYVKEKILPSFIKTFIDLLSVTHVNASNLFIIADTSNEVIRCLKSIDTNASHKGIWLIYVKLEMVDTKMREE